MPNQNTVPDLVSGQIAQLQRDVAELKRRTIAAHLIVPHQWPIIFSYGGDVVNNYEWEPFYPDAPLTFSLCRFSALTPGVGTSTVELRKNGSPLQSVNLAAAAITVTAVTAIPLAVGDRFTTKMTAVGGGLANITVEMSILQ